MRIFYLIVAIAVSPTLSGCGGGDGVEMADVSGVITYQGEPLADAEVHFVSGKFEGYGRTDDQGRYSLVRGAPVGECKVYITKPHPDITAAEKEIDLTIEGMDEEQIRALQGTEGESGGQEPFLPPEYSDPEQTRLTITVPSGGTEEADFKL